MELGILTAPLEDMDLMDVGAWAGSNGFSAMEVACWPASGGERRRYAGTSHINVDGLGKSQGADIKAGLAEHGVSISGLGYYPNPLHKEAEHRDEVIGHLVKVITAASTMEVPVVNTFLGGDRSLNVDENWARAIEIFNPIVAHAQASGVRLCFENCPMIFSYDEWPGGHNIAYSPKIWRRIFDQWGDAVGMNFDPSHLIWQFIDQTRFIKEFGPQMAHVHAKDVMIDQDGLYENGTMSTGMGWQIPRLCGLGDVDWSGFFSGLYRAGYDGPVIIEHEDRDFEGTEDRVKRGFLLARDVLTPYIK
ncbi:sugar phosphate isomerase/epimerase [Gymnodinialimonas sp. 57CJ19]|uniref:sugar phosphate isomerase/epimerase family protein n=1 Tax=Gymnodinialimonas sp. 57CJ19 TaxID=3138498 RepID=UPI0031346170